jgi:hypothetical protein
MARPWRSNASCFAMLPSHGPAVSSVKSRDDDDVVMARAGILESGFECHGHHRQVPGSRFHERGPVLAAESEERGHHESEAGSYCPRCVGAHGKRGKCTTPDRQSNEHSVSVAYIWASLWVCPAGSTAISVIDWLLRIVFAGEAIVPKSRPRAVSDARWSGILLVGAASLCARLRSPENTPGSISRRATFLIRIPSGIPPKRHLVFVGVSAALISL